MIINAVNNTNGILTYSRENVTIAATSTVALNNSILVPFSCDPNVLADIKNGNLSISDTVTTFDGEGAVNFLNRSVSNLNSFDQNGSGTMAALNATVVANTNGCAAVAFNLTGTWVATILLEGTVDGTTWFSITGMNPSGSPSAGFAANTPFIASCGGFSQVRVRANPYTSGTINVAWNAGAGGNSLQVYNVTASAFNAQTQGNVNTGVADSGNPVKTGAVFNSSLPTVANGQRVDNQADVNGRLLVSSRELKDSNRNQTNFFMPVQIVSTSTDTLMSLTGYKGGIAVVGTTTPAVVSAGKTYRITSITLTYVTIVTTPGAIRFTLRANTGGVVAISSPIVCQWTVGEPTGVAPVAGKFNTVPVPFPDGLEFAAGTGIGISQIGLNTVGTAAAVGYGIVTINGFEY